MTKRWQMLFFSIYGVNEYTLSGSEVELLEGENEVISRIFSLFKAKKSENP